VVSEIRHPETGRVIERHTPSIVLAEKPPDRRTAKNNWQQAKSKLLNLKREIDTELQALEHTRRLCLKRTSARGDLKNEETAHAVLAAQEPESARTVSDCRVRVANAGGEHRRRTNQVHSHRQTRPGFFARVFRTDSWRIWSSLNAPLVDAERKALRHLKDCEQAFLDAGSALETLTAKIRSREESLDLSRQRVAQLSKSIDADGHVSSDKLVDETLFNQGHERWNLAAPWLPETPHHRREDLFIAALAVHRAFIDVAAQKILHNLSVLMDVFSSGAVRIQRHESFSATFGRRYSWLCLLFRPRLLLSNAWGGRLKVVSSRRTSGHRSSKKVAC